MPLFVSAILFGCLSFLFVKAVNIQPDILAHLLKYQFAEVFFNTIVLTILTLVFALIWAFVFAWITSQYDFWGRNFFKAGLLWPLSIPTYVLAFIYLAHFDVGAETFEIAGFRSIPGLAFVLSLSLYPYLYFQLSSALSELPPSLIEVAKTLGKSRQEIWKFVKIPLLTPALLAGLHLIGMEVLADFGSASLFNINVLSTLIYKSWFSLHSIEGAAFFSIFHVVLVSTFTFIMFRYKKIIAQQNSGIQRVERKKAKILYSFLFFFSCLIFLALSFFLPVLQLCHWSIKTLDAPTFFQTLLSFRVPLIFAFFCSIAALICSFFYLKSRSKISTFIASFSLVGYGIPGSVFAVALLLVWIFFFKESAFKNQFLYLILGLGFFLRFLSLTVKPMKASFEKISPTLMDVASTLGASQKQIARSVYWPLLKNTALGSFVFITVDILKEMSLSMMLRPAGYKSPAILIYQYTSESLWAEAAPSALMLVFFCLSLITVSRKLLQ